MSKGIAWDAQIGRRLRLRDLHAFFTVVQCGSMAKAAEQLSVSQPAVSKTIIDLEHALGVRLLDRGRRGVEPTIYGNALLKRGLVAFDELKQSIRDIQFLADPTAGELTIGCADSIAATILRPIVDRFSDAYPDVALRVDTLPSPAINDPGLRDRKYDLVLGRRPMQRDELSEELKVEILFHDYLTVVVGKHTNWARRRKIDLVDLAEQAWILPPRETWTYGVVAKAFRARGLGMPKVSLMTFSLPLVTHFLAGGPFVTALPNTVASLHPARDLLSVLPVGDISASPWPVVIVTLKDRTLSPIVERFIECARDMAQTFSARQRSRQMTARRS
jgi:DNA-binding transcriptional LysR family regulator